MAKTSERRGKAQKSLARELQYLDEVRIGVPQKINLHSPTKAGSRQSRGNLKACRGGGGKERFQFRLLGGDLFLNRRLKKKPKGGASAIYRGQVRQRVETSKKRKRPAMWKGDNVESGRRGSGEEDAPNQKLRQGRRPGKAQGKSEDPV